MQSNRENFLLIAQDDASYGATGERMRQIDQNLQDRHQSISNLHSRILFRRFQGGWMQRELVLQKLEEFEDGVHKQIALIVQNVLLIDFIQLRHVLQDSQATIHFRHLFQQHFRPLDNIISNLVAALANAFDDVVYSAKLSQFFLEPLAGAF